MGQAELYYSEVLGMPDRPIFHLLGTSEPKALVKHGLTTEVRNVIFWLALALVAFVVYEEWMRSSVNQENACLKQMVADRDAQIIAMPDAITGSLIEKLKAMPQSANAPVTTVEPTVKPKPIVIPPRPNPKRIGQAETYANGDSPAANWQED